MAKLTTQPTVVGGAAAAATKKDLPPTSHYKLGDLGLIPRPELKQDQATRASNVAHLSYTTRVGMEKQPLRVADLATAALKQHGILPPIAPDGAAI